LPNRDTKQAAGPSTVHLDTRPDRNNTLTGGRFWRRLAWRALGVPFLITLAMSSVWIPTTPASRLLLAGSVGFAILVLGSVVAHGLVLWSDYSYRKPLGAKYRCVIRPGFDTHQHRVLQVTFPPGDLPDRVRRALQAVSPDMRVREVSATRFEGEIPRKRQWVTTEITVDLEPRPDETIVRVESKMTEWLGFVDSGRSIINVEEFQLALRDLVEGRPASPEVKPAAHTNGPEKMQTKKQ
jgi:hypothetical protein